MANLICFDKQSGMPIFAKQGNPEFKIPQPLLLTLQAAKSWGESESGGGVQLISSSSGRLELYWESDRCVSWLLVAEKGVPETQFVSFMKVVRSLWRFIVGDIHSDSTAFLREIKGILRDNPNFGGTLDKLLIGIGNAPQQKYFADLTGKNDVCFSAKAAAELDDMLEDFSERNGVDAAVLLFDMDELSRDKGWEELRCSDKIGLKFFTLTNSTNPKIPVQIGERVKYLFVSEMTPSVKLLTLSTYPNLESLAKRIEIFRRNQECQFQGLKKEYEDGCHLEVLFAERVEGILILERGGERCWSSVKNGGNVSSSIAAQRIKKLRNGLTRVSQLPNSIASTYLLEPTHNFYFSRGLIINVLVLFGADCSVPEMTIKTKLIEKTAEELLRF